MKPEEAKIEEEEVEEELPDTIFNQQEWEFSDQ
jgi:hypothetical protein